MDDQDLSVYTATGTDADDGDTDFLGDSGCQSCRNFLQHDGKTTCFFQEMGILNHGKMLFEGSLQALQKHSRGGILLRVLDVPKSIAVLNRQGIRAVTQAQHPDVLELPALPDEALAALVSTLAENGVGVVGLTAQTKNLEDIFLSLTQNNGEVA